MGAVATHRAAHQLLSYSRMDPTGGSPKKRR